VFVISLHARIKAEAVNAMTDDTSLEALVMQAKFQSSVVIVFVTTGMVVVVSGLQISIVFKPAAAAAAGEPVPQHNPSPHFTL